MTICGTTGGRKAPRSFCVAEARCRRGMRQAVISSGGREAQGVECIVLAKEVERRTTLKWVLEDLGPAWRCVTAEQAEQALLLMRSQRIDAAVLTACSESAVLAGALQAQPLLAPPYLFGDGFPALDGELPGLAELPGLLQWWKEQGRLPALAQLRYAEAERLATGMLRALGVPGRLRAWTFLPDMAALTAVHPAYLTDLQHGLYPVTGQRHRMTAGAVERSLRLCVEATWSRGALEDLERFFGSSVDPDRGKPTNREFLCRVQERITLGASRLRH